MEIGNSTDPKTVSIRPSEAVAEEKSKAELIAAMSLVTFLNKTGAKIIESATPDQWATTSSRAHLRGLMERYDDFCLGNGTAPYSVFKVQELHWLSHCQVNAVMQKLRESYVQSLAKLSRSKYCDLTKYCGDIPSFDMGRPVGSPITTKRYLPVSAEVMLYANALQVDFSLFVEIGRGWSLTTVLTTAHHSDGKPIPEYGEWADEVFWPVYRSLMDRAGKLADARREALVLLGWRTASQNGSVSSVASNERTTALQEIDGKQCASSVASRTHEIALQEVSDSQGVSSVASNEHEIALQENRGPRNGG